MEDQNEAQNQILTTAVVVVVSVVRLSQAERRDERKRVS